MHGQLASRAVYSALGVTAGCGTAMFLLGCMILEPIDEFLNEMQSYPIVLTAYVDDFIIELDFTKGEWPHAIVKAKTAAAALACAS